MQNKLPASQNALKHGLTSRKMYLLRNENPERWDKLLADFNAEFEPTSPFEERLVEEIAFAYWRMQRAWVTESSIMDSEMDGRAEEFARKYQEADEGIRQGEAFRSLADTSKSFPLVIRYEARLHTNAPSRLSRIAGPPVAFEIRVYLCIPVAKRRAA